MSTGDTPKPCPQQARVNLLPVGGGNHTMSVSNQIARWRCCFSASFWAASFWSCSSAGMQARFHTGFTRWIFRWIFAQQSRVRLNRKLRMAGWDFSIWNCVSEPHGQVATSPTFSLGPAVAWAGGESQREAASPSRKKIACCANSGPVAIIPEEIERRRVNVAGLKCNLRNVVHDEIEKVNRLATSAMPRLAKTRTFCAGCAAGGWFVRASLRRLSLGPNLGSQVEAVKWCPSAVWEAFMLPFRVVIAEPSMERLIELVHIRSKSVDINTLKKFF